MLYVGWALLPVQRRSGKNAQRTSSSVDYVADDPLPQQLGIGGCHAINMRTPSPVWHGGPSATASAIFCRQELVIIAAASRPRVDRRSVKYTQLRRENSVQSS